MIWGDVGGAIILGKDAVGLRKGRLYNEDDRFHIQFEIYCKSYNYSKDYRINVEKDLDITWEVWS